MALAPSNSIIDLSRLPPPPIVEAVSFEAVREELIADLQAAIPDFDAIVESDPVVKLIETWSYRELLRRQNFNDRARGRLLAFAAAGDLDHVAAPFGVERLELTAADPESGAEAVMEADEDFRRRVLLAPSSFSVAGPDTAYVFHALSAHPEVLDASATSPTPGDVVVSVLSRLGTGTASAEILDAVEAAVTARKVRPLTDHVTVQSAEILPFAIVAQLWLYSGPDSSVVIQAAQAKLAAYLEQSRRLGRDITRSAIFAALHVEGVQRVVLASPSADVVATALQAAHCTGITLSFAGHDE